MILTFFVAAQLSAAENTVRHSPQSTEVLGIFVEDDRVIVTFNSFVSGTTLVIGIYCDENRFITSASTEITHYVVAVEDFSVPPESVRVKAMVWDSTNTMRPLGGYATSERIEDEWVFTPAEDERITAEILFGNILLLSGNVTPHSEVFIRIFRSDNKIETIGGTISDSQGDFAYVYDLSNSINGSYLVAVSVAGYDKPILTTFDRGLPSERAPMSFNLPTTTIPASLVGVGYWVNTVWRAPLVNEGEFRVATQIRNNDPRNVQYIIATVGLFDQNHRLVDVASTGVSIAPLATQTLENVILLPSDVTGHYTVLYINEGLNLYHYGMTPFVMGLLSQSASEGIAALADVNMPNVEVLPTLEILPGMEIDRQFAEERENIRERIFVSDPTNIDEYIERLNEEMLERMNQSQADEIGIIPTNLSSGRAEIRAAVTSILQNEVYTERQLRPDSHITIEYTITNTGTAPGAFAPWTIVFMTTGVASNGGFYVEWAWDAYAIVTVPPGEMVRYTKTFYVRPAHIRGINTVFATNGTWVLVENLGSQSTVFEGVPTGFVFSIDYEYEPGYTIRDFFGNNITAPAPNLFYGGPTNVTLNRYIEGMINHPGDVDFVRIRDGTPTEIIVENQGNTALTVSAFNLTHTNAIVDATSVLIPANSSETIRLQSHARYIRIGGVVGGTYRMRINGSAFPITMEETPTSVTFYARVLFANRPYNTMLITPRNFIATETYAELFMAGVRDGWGGNFGGREISVEFIDVAGTNPAPGTFITVSRVVGSTSVGAQTFIDMSTGHTQDRESFMNTSAHEFGHSLGLGDAYPYRYAHNAGDSSIAYPGFPSLMNNSGYVNGNAQDVDYDMLLTFRTWEWWMPVTRTGALPYSWHHPLLRNSLITPRDIVWRHNADFRFNNCPRGPECCGCLNNCIC